METTFEIPAGSIWTVSKYLTKLQKRANKAGQEVVFTFRFDEEIKSRKFDTEDTEGNRLIATYKYRVLRVNQDITVHEGWIPVAKIDIAQRQMKAYSTYTNSLESLGEALWTKHCDHCGHSKIKHTAFVMQNGDKFMKVGSGCMKELAPATAGLIAREFDIYAMWSSYLSAMAKPEGGDGQGGGRGWGSGVSVEYVYDKPMLILAMRAAIEKSGGKWVTSEYESDKYRSDYGAVTNKGRRTFDFITGLLQPNFELSMIPDADYVASVNADVNKCLEKYPHLLGEKIEGVKTFAAADKSRAIDIFLVKTCLDILRKEAEKEKMRTSEHQGATGTKVPLTLELVSTKHGQGAYGGWTLWIFKDENGNMFKKFGEVSERFKADGKYKFTAPIKGFETYDEIKYTVLGGPLSKYKAA